MTIKYLKMCLDNRNANIKVMNLKIDINYLRFIDAI